MVNLEASEIAIDNLLSPLQLLMETRREQARQLLQEWGNHSLSYLMLNPDNRLFFESTGQAFVAYRVNFGAAITVGDPTGHPEAIKRCISEFSAACRRKRWVPVFFSIEKPHRHYRTLGYKGVQVAEDAAIELELLEFKGKNWQDVRTSLNRANREEIQFCRFSPENHEIMAQFRQISREWVRNKNMPELGFTLGTIASLQNSEVRCYYAIDKTGKVHGMVSWLPRYTANGWTLDLMRRRNEAMPGIMEFLIARSALAFREEGYNTISLGASPLTADNKQEGMLSASWILKQVKQYLHNYYDFEGLHDFKRKFLPTWKPLYAFYPGGFGLTQGGLAILRLYLSN
jgi:lysylphosphatidylglycerol synthetase-like protein (DUF2156 family)